MNANDSGLFIGLEKTHLSTKISRTPNLYDCPTYTSKVFILAVILSNPCKVSLLPSIHEEAYPIFEKIIKINPNITFLKPIKYPIFFPYLS